MKLPRTLKIGGRRYKLRLVKDELDGSNGGLNDSSKLTITLESDATPVAIRHRLLHEVIHALNFELDEKDTEFWTMLLEQILVDNPEFTKLFLKNGG